MTAKSFDLERSENSSVGTSITAETDVMDRSENNSCHISGEELVWYFSYGSNMNPAVFEKKRKIKCRDFRVCKVPGYVLTYTQAMVPYSEPAFCTCVKRSAIQCEDDRPDIHGVAFLITRTQYEHMLLTEGGWGWQEYRYNHFWSVGHYAEVEVECREIQPEGSSAPILSKPFKALTLAGLLGVRNKYDANSSKRYHDLVNVGAEASGLPKSYREYLKKTHPPFEPTNCIFSKIAKRIYLAALIPIFIFEIGTMILFVRWSESKLEKRDSTRQQQSLQDPSIPRQSFQDVVRPPWIIMKACFLYRTIVLEIIVYTFLYDLCKFPNGFRNKCVISEATIASDKKSL
jgi:hypothetical protein